MNIYKNYINPFLQGVTSSQLALFIAILSMVFVVTLKDGSRCLDAQCVAGANEVMAGDITIKSSNPNGTTLKSTSIADIDINLPATTGTLLHSASSLGNNQYLQTDSSGNISTGTIPALDIDDSAKVDTTGGTTGQILKVASSGGLEFANYEINETQFDSSNATTLGQFLRSNATNGLDFDTLELDDITVSGSANDEVRISATGDLEIFTPGATVINETTFDSSNGTQAQYLIVNGSNSLSYDSLELDDIGLTGSPSAGDQVRVNASGELETYTPAGGGDVTLVASGNTIMNSAFGSFPQTGANICWFTQAGKLDDSKSYELIVEFNNYEGQIMNSTTQSNRPAYWNPLFYSPSITDCGDTTNNNNGFNENFWSFTQNMPWEYAPNNSSFTNGYAKSSGVTWTDCCMPLYPLSNSQGGVTSYLSASRMTMQFSPFQDSVFSSSYKVGFTAKYDVNGFVHTNATSLNPTNNIVSAWQIMGNATNLGNVQNGTSQSNDRKFEDFQGIKMGCWAQNCFNGNTTWALYELNR